MPNIFLHLRVVCYEVGCCFNKFCIVKQTISKCQMHDIEPMYLWLLKYKSEFFQSVFYALSIQLMNVCNML